MRERRPEDDDLLWRRLDAADGPPPRTQPAGRDDAADDDTPLAPTRDLVGLALLAGSAVLFYLLLPALLLIWISGRWTIAEKLAATVLPLALLAGNRAVGDTSDAAQMLGVLAIASCIGMAFFLAARLVDRARPR